MGSRIYIASALTNWRVVREARDILLANNRIITFDWTPWAEEIELGVAKPDWSPEGLHSKAVHELSGVCAADYLLLILPGKRGTHTEFGAFITKYICQDKGINYQTPWPITLFDTKIEPDPVPTSFHYIKWIYRAQNLGDAISNVLAHTEPYIHSKVNQEE